MEGEILKCPECGSEEVTVSHLQRFMANTGEHYCHSVKTHDANSEATCLKCQWQGERRALAWESHETAEREAAQRKEDAKREEWRAEMRRDVYGEPN